MILFSIFWQLRQKIVPLTQEEINKQVIVDIHYYLRKEINLLKVAGNDPIIRANNPKTTATIAASTKRSFQLYFIKQ